MSELENYHSSSESSENLQSESGVDFAFMRKMQVESLEEHDENAYLKAVSHFDALPGFDDAKLQEVYDDADLREEFETALHSSDKKKIKLFKKKFLKKYWKGEGDAEVYMKIAFRRFSNERKIAKFLVSAKDKEEIWLKVADNIKKLNEKEDLSQDEYSRELALVVAKEIEKTEDEDEKEELLKIWQNVSEEEDLIFEEEEEELAEENVVEESITVELSLIDSSDESVEAVRQSIETDIEEAGIPVHNDGGVLTVEMQDYYFDIDIYKKEVPGGEPEYSFLLKNEYTGNNMGPYLSSSELIEAAGKSHLDAFVVENVKHFLREPDSTARINHKMLVGLAEKLVGDGQGRGYRLGREDIGLLKSFVRFLTMKDDLSIENKISRLNDKLSSKEAVDVVIAKLNADKVGELLDMIS